VFLRIFFRVLYHSSVSSTVRAPAPVSSLFRLPSSDGARRERSEVEVSDADASAIKPCSPHLTQLAVDAGSKCKRDKFSFSQWLLALALGLPPVSRNSNGLQSSTVQSPLPHLLPLVLHLHSLASSCIGQAHGPGSWARQRLKL
jgi:hypothetical protein